VPSEDPTALIGTIVILLLALSWHEAAHAWVADRLGDPTARELGRVSLNPLRHLDPFLSVVLPVAMYLATGMAFGGGKPVPINVANFRHRARDFMLVALAGPGSNLVLALVFGLVWVVLVWMGVLPSLDIHDPFHPGRVYAPTILGEQSLLWAEWLQTGVFVNLLLAVFNLMPFPPLDGSRIIGWLLPRPLQPHWYALDRFGLIIVLVFVFWDRAQAMFIGVAWEVIKHFGDAVDHLAGLGPVA
jgi:Zn-dependent protease